MPDSVSRANVLETLTARAEARGASEREIPMSAKATATAQLRTRLLHDDGADVHLGHGVVAGGVGALAVAAMFGVIDAMTAGLLATPNALGRALLLGESFQLDQPLSFGPIAAYSLLHAGVFVGVAYLGAILVAAGRERFSRGALIVGAAGVMFLACQAGITSFAYVFEFPRGEFDLVRVAVANGFAALLMARVLVWETSDDRSEA